jgi:hypothetical protein
LKALSDVNFGFAMVTTLQMMTHLTNTYGSMTSADCEANLTPMNAPWSPPTPIEPLFQQLEAGQRHAVLAAEPIADTQLTCIGLHLITKTGMLPDGCREWHLQAVANQTWAAFKSHFQFRIMTELKMQLLLLLVMPWQPLPSNLMFQLLMVLLWPLLLYHLVLYLME